MKNGISYSTYRAAADRCRRGEPHAMDLAVCEVYEAGAAPAQAVRSVFDLDVARRMWRADGKQTGA
jgi:hypothetical protein